MNGMPLLSQLPPENPDASNETACRRCNKEFNFLFARQKRCDHCGYAYCSSCADFQALMPRSGHATDSGYEVHPVCGYCMEMLTITASSKHRLRALPLTKLRTYMKAYNIGAGNGALEKDDLVEAVLHARGSNGCLLPTHEDYYRKNSVPKRQGERSRTRSFFSRPARQQTSPPTNQPRQPQYAPPPGPPPPHARAGPPPTPYQHQHHDDVPQPQMRFPQPQPFRHDPPPTQQRTFHAHPEFVQQPHHNPPPAQQPYHHNPPAAEQSTSTIRPSASQSNFQARSPSSHPGDNQPRRQSQPPPVRPRSAAPTVPAAAPTPVPTLESLLEKSSDQISRLSISTLKAVLFQNRVNSSLGMLEKEDLVRKVLALVEDERRERQRKEREEREEAERMEWARREREKQEKERKAAERERKRMEEERQRQGEPTNADEKADEASAGSEPKPGPKIATLSIPYPERTQDGLCVVCQDYHANMAIIDCGHLALCKSCSEIVMKTTRECPLCRTRIVTEQRLLRIFKT